MKINRELKSYEVPGMKPNSIWQLLYAIRDCGLKNDALLLSLYEFIAEKYPAFTNRSTDMEHIDVFRREDK